MLFASATAGAALMLPGGCRRQTAPSAPTVALAPQPAATQPTSAPTTAPIVRATYLDVVRANYSGFAATQPLDDLLDLPQAAHFKFGEPIYLSPPPRSEMWITRPDAPSTPVVLRAAADPQVDIDVHVIAESVEFVDWIADDSGRWIPWLVCRNSDGQEEVVNATGRRALRIPPGARWDLAFAWNDKVVVPGSGVIDIIDLAHDGDASHFDFQLPHGSATAAPLALPDAEGIIAWVPWDAHLPGSGQAARFVDGKWSALSAEKGWPGRLIHVVPLLDGSAMQLLGNDDGSVQLAMTTIENAQVDAAKIAALVDQLSDAEEQKRVDAYQELTRYGPGIWPILQKLAPDQPAEAAARLDQLLAEKNAPTLGGMKLLGHRSMTVAQRLGDGGVVFYVPEGVSIADSGDQETVESPAWITVRPGEPISLLPAAMTVDLKPGESHLWALGDEWIVQTDVRGPRRFIGNGFVALRRADEDGFDDLIGIDRRGRWVLHKTGSEHKFLVIDPTLPDPTPRLPAWEFTTAEAVGWDKNNWPVVKHDSAYALTESDWRLLDPAEKIGGIAAKQPPSPATTQSTQPPLLVDSNGTQYFDGQTALKVVDRSGRQIVWPLPAVATGSAAAHLLRTSDGRLYLFNQPGRLLRICATPDATEPFKIEATFTHSIPDTEHPTRIWLDPAGRIDIEWDNRLTIFFPSGYIPSRIAEKMLTDTQAEP